MGLIKNLKILKKDSNERNKVKNIVDKLPENSNVAKDILQILGNETTKVVFDKDIKNNYYTYLNDTIYLTENKKYSQKNRDGRICVIAHECRHSVQSKVLQNFNFILSNIELIAFVVSIILLIFRVSSLIVLCSYLCIVIFSIIPRMILEINAVLKSVPIAKMYLEKKLNKEDVETVNNFYTIHTKTLLPLFIISLLFEKIVRSAIIYILYLIVK